MNKNIKEKNRESRVENRESFGYTFLSCLPAVKQGQQTRNKRSTSGRELNPPSSKRTSQRLVPPEVVRSQNVNRVMSQEDWYKATLERTRPLQNNNQKEVSVMFYVGIDWANDHHDVFITDDSAKTIFSFTIPHTVEGIQCLEEKFHKLTTSKEQILIAIETPKNLLVYALLDKGYTVYSINPKSVDRYRDRYRTSGAKDDTFDAMVIANILRTDLHQFKPIMPDSELVRELKILTIDQQHLIKQKVKLLNQIQACLKDYYTTALQFFSEIDQDITINFLLQYPAPKNISVKEFEETLRANHYPHPQEKAKEIHSMITSSQIFSEAYIVRAKSRFVTALLHQLKQVKKQIDEYQEEINQLFEKHPDKDIFKSLPGCGEKNAPRLLAEFGDNKERFNEAKDVQCQCGTAPITEKSGKMKIVKMRLACRKLFRNTIYQFSFSTLKQSVWAKNFYNIQRAKGKSHTEALRALGNKWIKIIFHLWKNNCLYDENRHLADLMRHQFTSVYAT